MKSWAKTNNRYFALPYWFDYAFLIIFALCAWYLQNTFIRNYSGTGLQLPFNNLIWAALALGVLLLFKSRCGGKTSLLQHSVDLSFCPDLSITPYCI